VARLVCTVLGTCSGDDMAATTMCSSCHGSELCEICKGDGSVQKSRADGDFCSDKSVCEVCFGSGKCPSCLPDAAVLTVSAADDGQR
jgi:DnaJ-class molecular chaperone